jgi:hypothetical protein
LRTNTCSYRPVQRCCIFSISRSEPKWRLWSIKSRGQEGRFGSAWGTLLSFGLNSNHFTRFPVSSQSRTSQILKKTKHCFLLWKDWIPCR